MSTIVGNSVLIWLDTNSNGSNDNFYRLKDQLQHVVQTIKIFVDVDQCIDFLTDIQDEKVFLVVFEGIAQQVIPSIHNIDQLYAVYIFSEGETTNQQWIQHWWKIKGIYLQTESICDILQQEIKQYDQNSISMSFIPNDEDIQDKNLNQLDPTFMYTQILKEIILEIRYNKQSIQDFATYCQSIHCAEVSSIDAFERNYASQQPIWWYTSETYLYPMLNHALRTLETDIIIKIGFFINDLYKNIERLHSEQFNVHSPSFTVYRGQSLSKADFDRLMKTNGGLLSFNNFLSTSLDKDISLIFADSNQMNPDLVGILFVINIDPSISSVPFACVKDISRFSDENEILFSMHTIFRINDIKKPDHTNEFWQVELKLTSDNDQQLRLLTDRIRIETGGGKSWLRMGFLLMKIGHFNKAEEVYMSLLNQTSDAFEKAAIYNQLGLIKQAQGEFGKAIEFCEKCIEISRKILPENDPDLATMYGNHALIYDSIGKHNKAISLFEKCLKIRQKVLPSNDPYLAISYMNLGMMYFRKNEYTKTLSFYEKAQRIFKESLPSNHPDLALSYHHIACAYERLGNYPNALLFHKKALDIREKVLSPNHPDFTVSYVNIATVYEAMGNYSQALSYHEKAREIYEKILPFNHPMLATFYNNVASVYHAIGEYRKSLKYYEQAHEILAKNYSADHPDLATSYNNLANIYYSMKEYEKALLTQQKAHEIIEKSFPINYQKLATSYNNMAAFYKVLHDSTNALQSNEKALEIRQQHLPPNHPDLATSYNNIGTFYFEIGDYRKAFPFFEHAFNILKQSVPDNHPNLQSLRETLSFVRQKLSIIH